ncbi:hypothetical protein [Rubrivirga sp.]|uniref:hypothetical protein n=1 Tax=Rubrivirga sp. TaxID=1885344 RepID=UPI003C730C50
MSFRLLLAAALVLPLAACGGDDSDSFDGDVEETGEPGILGQLSGMADAVEEMQAAAERPPAEPINFRELRELLPGDVGGIEQTNVEGSTDGAMGFSISQVEADYDLDDTRYDIGIMDYGAIPTMSMMGLGWTMGQIDRESGTSYERTVTFGGEKGLRKYDTESRSGEFSLLVADRFLVSVSGRGVDDDDLEAALRSVDLEALAGMKDVGRPEA